MIIIRGDIMRTANQRYINRVSSIISLQNELIECYELLLDPFSSEEREKMRLKAIELKAKIQQLRITK